MIPFLGLEGSINTSLNFILHYAPKPCSYQGPYFVWAYGCPALYIPPIPQIGRDGLPAPSFHRVLKGLVAEWIHFTLFGMVLPTVTPKVYTFWGGL